MARLTVPPPPPPKGRNGIVPPVIAKAKRKHPLESTVEQYLKRQIGKLGGKSWKFSSPNHKGVFDQVALINGLAIFIEVKTVVGKASPTQEIFYRESTKHGGCSRYVFGHAGVDKLINDLKTGIEAPKLNDQFWWENFVVLINKEYK